MQLNNPHAPAKNFDSGFSHEYILMKRMLDRYSFIVRTYDQTTSHSYTVCRLNQSIRVALLALLLQS